VDFTIEYHSDDVAEAILELPDTLAFVKKSQRTPPSELDVARSRMNQVRYGNP
jgi:hypothetical protein